ncbi:HlyD family efflux transporter periplasmic adaptor subunit [Microbulbifer aggregans]|uniref:HlyD family efflux transporter periplasmic adaptor subunit n=1 Tax=Microbulbifer aggregans TaxID=1769779 RepID=UPI001CFF3DB3|nr:HlyD family efflux transporter periplasmic adaptor subunit [Microbulbifer aggregans]
MKTAVFTCIVATLLMLLGFVYSRGAVGIADSKTPGGHDAATGETGPHQGRVLREGDFAVELAIFESGVSPEFRAWVSEKGKPLDPKEIIATVTLDRLGGDKEQINFVPKEDYLQGNKVIREPHSFVVTVDIRHRGKTYHWQYESFEGRTRISAENAEAMGIQTAIAGPAVLREATSAYGRLVVNPEQMREVRARFDGTVDTVKVALGERVARGQAVVAVNSNENLKSYTIHSPIDGVVLQRNANPGEQTGGRNLLVIGDDNALLAELEVFPAARSRVRPGNPVSLTVRGLATKLDGVVQQVDPIIRPNQASIVRVALRQTPTQLAAGAFLSAVIQIDEYEVPLAVKRSALQSFRDFTVVYARYGDQYEVRMLKLGRETGEWVEVLDGLKPGTRYVTQNSYIIKADIEKSGAAHDH